MLTCSCRHTQAAPPPRYHSNVGRDFFSRQLELFPRRQWAAVGGMLARRWGCSGPSLPAGARRGLQVGWDLVAHLGLGRFKPRRALGPRQHDDYGTAPCCSLLHPSLTPTLTASKSIHLPHPTLPTRPHHNQTSPAAQQTSTHLLHFRANSCNFRSGHQRFSRSSLWYAHHTTPSIRPLLGSRRCFSHANSRLAFRHRFELGEIQEELRR